MFTHRKRIVESLLQTHLPAIYGYREFVDDGGLVSYGPSISDTYRRAAAYVDKILKGTKPGDLPVAIAGQVRAGDQSQDRQGARPHRSALAARPRRRIDRIRIGDFRCWHQNRK
jgi:ABC transporter substrate binding protein